MGTALSSFYFDTELVSATGTAHSVLALLTRQTENGVTAGALAENVRGGISGKGGTGLSADLSPETKPSLVFFTALNDVSGEEAVYGEDQKHQRERVQNDGDHLQGRGYLPQQAEYSPQKQEDQFSGEYGVIQLICPIPSV
jgi:hypothetical protein